LGKELHFPLPVLRKIPSILRKGDFKVTVTISDKEVIDIEPGDSNHSYGIALDIGTSTIVGYLMNLNTAEELGVRSVVNPQRKFGADVISRIKWVHDRGEQGLKKLQDKVIKAINPIIEELYHKNRIKPANIYKAVIVGNPTMIHLFLGIDPSYIDHSPYVPVLRDMTSFKGRELQLRMNPQGIAYILPNVSGYLGADIIAGVLYTEIYRSDGLKLLVDIGVNGEIVLGNKDDILACSAAAGPAFEGISAQEGAICRVHIDEEVRVEVIGGGKPRGICGSGVIDGVGELLRLGLISKSGLYQPLPIPAGKRLVEINGQYRFLLVEGDKPIYLTQKDIRELQLAKGAIRAGIEILMKEMKIIKDEIEEVFLAGAFGSFLRVENVLRVGLLPEIPKVTLLGNAAGEGAKLCVVDEDKLNDVCNILTKIKYLELSYRSDFNDEFVRRIKFP
jgi:uncharacterized 2Fe-2S/4Fe-4S cluster protein (DUF4445 family)